VQMISNSMEQCRSWESRLAVEEIPQLFTEPAGLLPCFHMVWLLSRILSRLNSVHSLTHHSLRSILILSSLIWACIPDGGLFPWGLSTRILYAFLISPMCSTCIANLTLLDFLILIIIIIIIIIITTTISGEYFFRKTSRGDTTWVNLVVSRRNVKLSLCFF